jgi:hypothetical protein
MGFIIYPQSNNKLAVIIPVDTSLSIEEIAAKDVPEGVLYTILDSLEGVDNNYFDGYIYQEGAAVPDIAMCKQIHLDKFRAARAPKLAALDVAFMRAVEQADSAKQAEIAAAKQELRDVTKIELPNDLPSLKEAWPSILGPRPSA